MIANSPPRAAPSAASTALGPPRLHLGRAAILSVLLAVFFGLVSPRIDFLLGNTPLGSQHTSPGAIGALMLLVLVINPLLGLANRRWKLSSDEMLVVYLSCLFSALVAGIGGHNYWPSEIVGAFYYATPENKWLEVLRALPSWMTPALNDSGAYRSDLVNHFYSGLGPNQAIPWAPWLLPIVTWLGVVFAGLVMTGCLSVILRAQWSENEALAFPLLKLPVEMAQSEEDAARTGSAPFFRNRVMWIGFAVAAFVQLMNGLNLYFPDVPQIATGIEAGPLFTEAPWNQMGYIMIMQVFPIAVGLSFILTAEVGFSLWFFFWVFKLQYVCGLLSGLSAEHFAQRDAALDQSFHRLSGSRRLSRHRWL